MSILDDEYTLSTRGTAVIREVYDNDNAHEVFAEQLERALEASVQNIIIEPPRLGDETARWIAVGNCLHKTAVITGLTSIACCLGWPDNPYIYTPQAVISLCCSTLYTISWQFDPCVKYQVRKRTYGKEQKWGDVWRAAGSSKNYSDHELRSNAQLSPDYESYTVFADSKHLPNLPLISTISSTSPVVLTRKDDTRRKLLHCTVTLAATALVTLKLFRLFN